MTREEAIEILNTYDMSEDNDDTEFKSAIALVIEALEQKPKSEWQQDHEILKAYSDGVNDVLDEIKADIEQEYKVESERPYGQGLSRALEIIDRYKSEGGKE